MTTTDHSIAGAGRSVRRIVERAVAQRPEPVQRRACELAAALLTDAEPRPYLASRVYQSA